MVRYKFDQTVLNGMPERANEPYYDMNDRASLIDALCYIDPRLHGADIDRSRQLVNITLDGGTFQDVFPGEPLAEATERFLGVATRTEIGLARIALTHVKNDTAAIEETVTSAMNPEEKELFLRKVSALRGSRMKGFTPYFMRIIDGEFITSVARDCDTERTLIDKKFRRAQAYFTGGEEDETQSLLAKVTPAFPAQHSSVFNGLSDELPILNKELPVLKARLGDANFDYLASTLTSFPYTWRVEPGPKRASRISVLLRYLNGHYYGPPSSTDKEAKYVATLYERQYGFALRSWRPRSAQTEKPTPQEASKPKPSTYEPSVEDLFLVRTALKQGRMASLTKEAAKEAAKKIEVGLFARKKLTEFVQKEASNGENDQEHPSRTDLELLIKEGDEAMLSLLRSHIRIVYAGMRTMMHTHKSRLDRNDAMQAGMLGALEAIRRYDFAHPKDVRLIGYVKPWVKLFLQTEIYNKEWGVTRWQGLRIGYLRKHIGDLTEAWGREPTAEEISKYSYTKPGHERMSPDKVRELQVLNAEVNGRLRNVPLLRHRKNNKSEDKDDRLSAKSGIAVEFGVEAVEVFEKIFADNPLQLSILEAHFGHKSTVDEIAGDLDIEKELVNAQLKAALTTLQASISEEELRTLLAS